MSTSPAPDEKHLLSASPTTSQPPEPEKAIPTEVQTLIDACVCNAEDLVKAAELLLAQNLCNIVYHLGALALEEIGKSEIVGVMHAAKVRKGQVSDRHLDDHVRKLFWALWGPSFGHQLISGTQLEAYRGLATNIHETRLQGLRLLSFSTEPPAYSGDWSRAFIFSFRALALKRGICLFLFRVEEQQIPRVGMNHRPFTVNPFRVNPSE